MIDTETADPLPVLVGATFHLAGGTMEEHQTKSHQHRLVDTRII